MFTEGLIKNCVGIYVRLRRYLQWGITPKRFLRIDRIWARIHDLSLRASAAGLPTSNAHYIQMRVYFSYHYFPHDASNSKQMIIFWQKYLFTSSFDEIQRIYFSSNFRRDCDHFHHHGKHLVVVFAYHIILKYTWLLSLWKLYFSFIVLLVIFKTNNNN